MKDSSERPHDRSDGRRASSRRERPGVMARVRPLYMRRLKPSVEWEIVKALRDGATRSSLAEKYGVSVSYISALKKGRDLDVMYDDFDLD